MKATVFLGGGRITSALVAGLRFAGYDRPIVVHDRHSSKLHELKRQYAVIAEPDLSVAVESAHLLIMAVRSDSVRELLKEIHSCDIRGMTVVSLAAGIPLVTLRAALGRSVQSVRAMPSPVCRSQQGLTALTFGRGLSPAARAEVRALFALIGAVVEIPEKQFDAFTVTFSSSHGYHALAALIQAAAIHGLDRKIACLAAAHAFCDGIASWRAGKLSLENLLQEAATPGGTAAAVIASLDSAGYQRMVETALRAGIRQARKNSNLVA